MQRNLCGEENVLYLDCVDVNLQIVICIIVLQDVSTGGNSVNMHMISLY